MAPAREKRFPFLLAVEGLWTVFAEPAKASRRPAISPHVPPGTQNLVILRHGKK
jgi:hypothetical protein